MHQDDGYIMMMDTSRRWVPGSWSLEPWSLVLGYWSRILGPGAWCLGPGPWSPVPGPWSLVPGPWSLVPLELILYGLKWKSVFLEKWQGFDVKMHQHR